MTTEKKLPADLEREIEEELYRISDAMNSDLKYKTINLTDCSSMLMKLERKLLDFKYKFREDPIAILLGPTEYMLLYFADRISSFPDTFPSFIYKGIRIIPKLEDGIDLVPTSSPFLLAMSKKDEKTKD